MSRFPLARVRCLRAVDDCMDPMIPSGAVLALDDARSAEPGDLVVVEGDGAGPRARLLVDWDRTPWLVAVRGMPPVALTPPLVLVGVVAQVIEGL